MTTNAIATLILVGSFILFMVFRLEICYAMGMSTVLALLYLKVPLSIVFQGLVNGSADFTLLAIPFFVFMGDLMCAGKITDRIMDLAQELVGWMRGGLAMVNCVASLLFGGISGSPVADTASLGPIECDLMGKGGYPADWSWSLTMATSIQGMLIPPSHNMVIYAVAAGSVSIGALLMAGVLPGVVLCIVMCIYSYTYAKKKNIPVTGRFSAKGLGRAIITAFFPMLTVVIVVGGVVGGIMTATESACFAVLYALVLTLFILRTIPFRKLYSVARKTCCTMASIMVLMGVSSGFGWVVAYLGIPKMVSTFMLSVTNNRFVLLLITNVLLLFLGCFMSMGSILLIMTPILLPILKSVGVDPVQFGVIMIMNCGVGLCTPPVGGVLFVGSGISGIKLEKLSKTMLPFYSFMVIALLLMTYIPQLSLWLPSVLIH